MNADFITQNWPLTNPTVEPLKKSGERTVYKVRADEGIFTFKTHLFKHQRYSQ